jgi:hypothetical protein
MKSNSFIFFFFLMACFLTGIQTARAQHPFRGMPPHHPPSLERFKTELGLTDEQIQSIKAIEEKYAQKTEALHDELEEGEHPDFEAMHKIHEEQREEVHALLTEEQVEKLEQIHQEKREGRKEKWNSPEHKAFREKIKAYRQENILPVLAAQRLKLESMIEKEDRRIIDELRVEFKQIHQERKHGREEEAVRPEPEIHHKRMQAHKESFDKLRELVRKYEQPIQRLLNEIEDKAESWKRDLHKMHEEFADRQDIREERPHHPPRGPKGLRQAGEAMRKGHFLLMDPANPRLEDEEKPEGTDFRIFPNPATDAITLVFELSAEQQVGVEIRNERGDIVLKRELGQLQAGRQEVRIDLGDMPGGIYYCSLKQAEQLVTKPIRVSR